MEPTIAIPIELVEQVERDNILLFAGEGVNRHRLPSSAELAQELAGRCNYPSGEPLTLPRVAGFYELVRDRNSLITFLRDRLNTENLQPSQAHELIAQLEPRPRTLVTTCYDRLLEQALRQADIPYVPVVGNQDVAFAEESRTLLIWIWGVLDQPASLILTEDDHRAFLENRGNLSDVLRGELARRTWLFLGFDLEDEWFRSFYDTVHRGLDRYGRRAYVFGATPGDYTRLWWEKRNVSILETSVTQFLKALGEQLEQRRQSATGARPIGLPTRPAVDLPPAPLPSSPYKGLDSYGENDRSLFFGRDQEIERLAALIHAHRLVLFYGASGTGKTSLLQAGVIPRLRYSDPGYTVVVVRAFEDVRASIRHALARHVESATLSPDESLLDSLIQVTQELGPTVLMLDQFEEFFMHFDVETRRQIVDELAAVYAAQDVPVKIVFSLREDYLARMGELETRLPEIFRVRFQLRPLSPDQARHTITRPVEVLGKGYEPTLVDRLLADLADEGVMPPQLQLVCSTLYDQLSPADPLITLASYERLGGAAGILKAYLVGELGRLGGPERTLARSLLKELVDSQGNKRICTEGDLVSALGISSIQLVPVLEKLVRSHLVRPLDLEQRAETGYELAHEYLVHQIMGWLDPQESERKRVYELLRQDIVRWDQFRTPISPATLDLVAPHWGDLLLQPDDRALILRSAIQQGWDIEPWVERLGGDSGSADILLELLRAPEQAARQNAIRGWRTMPPHSIADEALVEAALNDPVPGIRAEAAACIGQRDPQRGVDLMITRAGVSQLRRVDALAHLWDETAPLRQLPAGLRLPVILSLARLRLKRSGRALLYHSVAGMVGGVAFGLLFGLLVSPLHWLVDKPMWERLGFSPQAVLAAWLIVGPWFTSTLGLVMILSSTLTLGLLKQPKRGWVLFSSALLSGIIMSLMLGVIYQGGFLRGALWQACFNGFVIGSMMGCSVAELFYRRQAQRRMPSLLVGLLLGAGAGLVTGTITSFFPPRHDIFVSWLMGITIGSALIVGGVTLAIQNADKFIAGLSPAESKGGWFQ
jgi:hypothetical protein